MKEETQKEQPIPVCRPATRGDMWTYFEPQADGSRILKVERGVDRVYFCDRQLIEVHRPVTRTFSKWFGLKKRTESFMEIEEGFYFIPCGKNPEDGYFYFTYYNEEVKLFDLPDETRFIPTDKFVIRQKPPMKKKKRESWFKKFIPSFHPKPELVPAS